ncbi:helix-turn-helix domain-containing protein [Pimelobacter simplex]
MAQAVGVDQSTLSKKLRGRVGLRLDELYAIGRVLGEDPADLLRYAIRDSNPEPAD